MLTVPDHVVLLHGVPRSGTSWLGQILNAHESVLYRYQPLFSHLFKNRIGPASTPSELRAFFGDVARAADPFVCGLTPEIHGSYPDFAKARRPSHLVIKHVRYHHLLHGWLRADESLRLVAVVRHPCAVLHSWLNAPREFNPQWDARSEWRWAQSKNQGRPEEFFGFERWKEAVGLFLRLGEEYPSRVCAIRYSDLLSNGFAECRRIFSFVGLEPTRQCDRFFKDSTAFNSDDPYSVFKVRDNDMEWQGGLDPAIASAILSDIEGTELEPFLD